MAKRRITDLIPEEAQKVTISSTENVIEVAAVTLEETAPIEVTAVVKSPAKSPAPIKEVIENPVNKELEIEVKKLQDSLKGSQKTENNLRQEITVLEAKLLQQKQAADKFKKELSEAKKAAVHLADENTKLSDEIERLKQEKAALESAKIEIAKAQPVESQQSQIQRIKQAEITKSMAYRKSNRSPDTRPRPKFTPPVEPDDSMQMWLLD